MKIDDFDAYEIKAEAFRIMTGHMAPGKDPASATYPAPFEERFTMFKQWIEIHGECVKAMLLAFQMIMPDEDE